MPASKPFDTYGQGTVDVVAGGLMVMMRVRRAMISSKDDDVGSSTSSAGRFSPDHQVTVPSGMGYQPFSGPMYSGRPSPHEGPRSTNANIRTPLNLHLNKANS